MAIMDESAKILIGVSDESEILSVGKHLLIEINCADPVLLDDEKFIRQTLIDAAEKAGATVLGDIVHPFKPQGVTGVVAVAESHLSIHTWPEHRGYASVDIYFCGEKVNLGLAADIIREKLNAQHVDCITVIRGPKKKYLQPA